MFSPNHSKPRWPGVTPWPCARTSSAGSPPNIANAICPASPSSPAGSLSFTIPGFASTSTLPITSRASPIRAKFTWRSRRRRATRFSTAVVPCRTITGWANCAAPSCRASCRPPRCNGSPRSNAPSIRPTSSAAVTCSWPSPAPRSRANIMAQLQVKPLAVLATVPDTQGIVEAQDVCIGGRSYPDRRHLRWVLRQPHGSGVIRLFGYMVAKTLRLAADEVTFDRSSFERALREIPQGTLVIIAPTHRSYMDFLLCSFLFFSQPELGVAIPHIAAAEEFSRIPILGRLFERAQAFFVRRGMQRQDYVALTARFNDLVTRQQTLQVFIEGTRSRSRQFLPPRHGLLRCIQETGQVATILPVAISYDRVTEEASFLDELAGKPKPTMKLRALSAWTLRLLRGEIKIGRVHIACGMPIKLDKTDRLRSVTRSVMGQLQRHTVATTFHLRSFLAHHPVPGVDADWLREAIVARGGRVLQSSCPAANTSALMERCLRYQWRHFFYAEARL